MRHPPRVAAITTALATAGATVAALVTTVLPAQAAAMTVRDGDDASIAADIKHVHVAHDTTLRVQIRAENLKRSRRAVQGAYVYVDTRGPHPGPERVIEMGLWKGADHVVSKARRWHRTGRVLSCGSSLAVDYRNEWATLELAPDCLGGKRHRVRVAVVTFERTKKKPYTDDDWLTGQRVFTPWMRRG